jgi:hypothetical protein
MKSIMRASRSLFALLALGALALSSCAEDTTGPSVGSGTTLDATIRGAKVSFDPSASISPPAYDASNTRATFNATVTGDTIRSLNIAFTYDIDNGTFPHTLTDPDVTIVYTEKVNGVSTLYNCALGGQECTITLSRSNREIVDGTFSSNLTTIDDPNKKVAISGSFSVKLAR